MLPAQKQRSWVTTAVVIVCAYESFTKGIMTLVLVPLSVLVLPLFIIVRSVAKDQFGSRLGKPIRLTSFALTISMLCTYVFMVGGGDTKDVLAFGFYKTTTDNTLVMALDKVAYFGFWGFTPVLFALLITLLFLNRFKH
jgi:hypothetical protein